MSLIPPLLENGVFITDLEKTIQIFHDYFILLCSTPGAGSLIPDEVASGVPLLSNITISKEKLLRVIRGLNPSKALGWGGMVFLCE